jgi:hypothetical protein
MVVAAGGKINQVIHADKKGDKWLPDHTTVFNVQVLNSTIYKAVTDQAPPPKPMTAKDYANHGFPFFELYGEPSGISGDFSLVNSIGEIDQKMDGVVKPDIVALGHGDGRKNASILDLSNRSGTLREFHAGRDLKKEYDGYHVAKF